MLSFYWLNGIKNIRIKILREFRNTRYRTAHSRYTRTGTCVRWGWGTAVTVAYRQSTQHIRMLRPLKFLNRFNSETVTCNGRLRSRFQFQKRNGHLDPELFKKTRWDFKDQGGGDGSGRGYKNAVCVKIAGGRSWSLGSRSLV